MKLTKAIREEFVDDVMNGIPVKYHFDFADAKSEIINAIEAQLPSDLLKVVREYPNLFLRNKRIELALLGYKNGYGHYLNHAVYVIDHPNCKMINIDKHIDQNDKFETEQDERDALRKRLLEIANSCTTLAKLKVALPELESYMPNEEVKRNLPVASGTVITDLLQLGLKIPK